MRETFDFKTWMVPVLTIFISRSRWMKKNTLTTAVPGWLVQTCRLLSQWEAGAWPLDQSEASITSSLNTRQLRLMLAWPLLTSGSPSPGSRCLSAGLHQVSKVRHGAEQCTITGYSTHWVGDALQCSMVFVTQCLPVLVLNDDWYRSFAKVAHGYLVSGT